MARKPTLRRQITALLDFHDVAIRDAFMESIDEITSRIILKDLIEQLMNNNIDAALEALHLEPAAFAKLEATIAQAYNAGGVAMTSSIPTLRSASGAVTVIRFDVRNPRAEAWLTNKSSKLITGEIIEDQLNGLRRVMTEGMEAGRNPRATALDITGRINRVTRRREGGLIGLNSRQMEYVSSARNELLSGEPAAMRNYLKRGRRDKRLDSVVRSAISDGKPVSAGLVESATRNYKNSLLNLRGETIGRTESLAAVNAGKHEGFVQGISKSDINPAHVKRVWSTAGDSRVRNDHAIMNGQEVIGLDTPFVSPTTGAMLKHPGDGSLGAGAEDIINCRCIEIYEVDYFEGRGGKSYEPSLYEHLNYHIPRQPLDG